MRIDRGQSLSGPLPKGRSAEVILLANKHGHWHLDFGQVDGWWLLSSILFHVLLLAVIIKPEVISRLQLSVVDQLLY